MFSFFYVWNSLERVQRSSFRLSSFRRSFSLSSDWLNHQLSMHHQHQHVFQSIQITLARVRLIVSADEERLLFSSVSFLRLRFCHFEWNEENQRRSTRVDHLWCDQKWSGRWKTAVSDRRIFSFRSIDFVVSVRMIASSKWTGIQFSRKWKRSPWNWFVNRPIFSIWFVLSFVDRSAHDFLDDRTIETADNDEFFVSTGIHFRSINGRGKVWHRSLVRILPSESFVESQRKSARRWQSGQSKDSTSDFDVCFTLLVQINEMPIEDLSLEEAQRLIETAKDQLILHTKPRGKEKKKKKNSSKALHSNYLPHHFNESTSYSTPRALKNSEKRCISFSTDASNIGIRLVGGNKYGLFIGEVQKNSLAEQAGLSVADKIFNVTSSESVRMFSRPIFRLVLRSISSILRI